MREFQGKLSKIMVGFGGNCNYCGVVQDFKKIVENCGENCAGMEKFWGSRGKTCGGVREFWEKLSKIMATIGENCGDYRIMEDFENIVDNLGKLLENERDLRGE